MGMGLGVASFTHILIYALLFVIYDFYIGFK
jgi:hypothetical protein